MAEPHVIPSFRKYFRLSVILSFIGMACTLLGGEQIVGTLASKVLSTQGLQSILGTAPQNQLQAVDIFLVQANINTVVAHYAPLLAYIWLGKEMDAREQRYKLENQMNAPEVSGV